MGSIGLPELLIILAVVLLIFGVGRIARVGGELGDQLTHVRKRASRRRGRVGHHLPPVERVDRRK